MALDAENTGAEQRAGFGLQSSIFNSVRSISTDLKKNYSILNDYVLTPGDEFTLYINQGVGIDINRAIISEYKVYLTNDFLLTVPFLGTIDVRDMNLQELQNYVVNRISLIIPIEYVNFVLSDPAQFNVFIYGGINLPGSFVANPLIRVIDAIAMAKGFMNNASYRKIHLIREDETLILDISKYYTKADFLSNPPLQPGDMIFVPQAETVVNISGSIQYPGVYELTEGEFLSDLIDFAGKFKPGANTEKIEIVRIDATGRQSILNISYEESYSFVLKNGDHIIVRTTSENRDMVTIEGAVFGKRITVNTPMVAPVESIRMEIPYYPGLNLLTLLDLVGGPTPYAKTEESFIQRKGSPEAAAIPVKDLWESRNLDHNIELFPGDYVCVPIENLTVFVSGMVIRPGAFPYRSDYTVWEYLLMAGGLDDNRASLSNIYIIDPDGKKVKVDSKSTVNPGDVVFAEKKLLFKSDQAMQNFFIITGWATTIVTLATLIVELLINLKGL